MIERRYEVFDIFFRHLLTATMLGCPTYGLNSFVPPNVSCAFFSRCQFTDCVPLAIDKAA